MSGERFFLDPTDEDLDLFDFRQVVRERVHYGINRGQFVQDTAGMRGCEVVRKIDEGRALFGNEDVLDFRVFRQWWQHRIGLWAGLKILKDLPGAITDVRRFENRLILRQ